MIVTQGLTTVTAVLARQRAGAFVVGFLAILNVITTAALFAFWLLLLRGLLAETAVGAFLRVPVVVPLGAFTVVVFSLWLARSVGLPASWGPMREDDTPDGYTGHAAEPWWRRTAQLREWTILERHQPAAFVIAGLLLCLMPWTRAVGLFMLAVALEASHRATVERRVEHQRKQAMQDNDPYARVVLPMQPVRTPKSIDQQLAEMGSEHLGMLDAESRRELESRIEQGWNEEGAATRSATAVSPVPRRVLREPMEPLPRGKLSMVLLITTLAVLVNFSAGDPAGLYEHMPAGFTGVLDSIDRELDAVGIQTEDEAGASAGLAGRVLEQVDPDELARREAGRRAAALTELADRLERFDTMLAEQRRATRQSLGVEIHPDAGTAAFDSMLLEDAEAGRTWISMINDLHRITAERDTLGRLIEDEDPSVTTARLREAAEEVDRLADVVASLGDRTEQLSARLRERAG